MNLSTQHKISLHLYYIALNAPAAEDLCQNFLYKYAFAELVWGWQIEKLGTATKQRMRALH